MRFDDVCPTMNWSVWERIEPLLHGNGIKPILAVVPDNRDPKLVVAAPRADFWDKVRAWQAEGWCIALHGYQHRYETREGGLMGINEYSEFAGLPEDVQREKLARALAIFAEQGVRADAWVAPAHSFDAVTVSLLLELGVETISDGFYYRPVRHLGAIWIPQQFWHFRPMPGGLWTVCLHCNGYGEAEIAGLDCELWREAHFGGRDREVRQTRQFPGSWILGVAACVARAPTQVV
jgi:peptidoglycan/xylan/chitin deacetylase (PgdA/CDA1 family)